MASEIKVDTISEKTSAGGVTIDSVKLKDGGIVISDAANIGSASDTDALAISSGGVVTFSQNPVFPDGGVAVADLDIDGATDIGAAIVDADLFIVDDGAGGTNRKVTASRLKTYTESGKILQVVSGVASAAATSTSSTFAQKSTPTVSITPSSSSNKVFVTGHIYGDPNTDYLMVTFGRVISGGATTTNISGETYGLGMFNLNREDNMSIHFLDSPSTTSAVSYYYYFKNDNNSTSVGLGHNSVGAAITAMEVKA